MAVVGESEEDGIKEDSKVACVLFGELENMGERGWDVLSMDHLRSFDMMYSSMGSGAHRLILILHH